MADNGAASKVSRTPQLESLVRRKIASGLYNSSSEVVREALRLLDERDRAQDLKLKKLRIEVQRGLESLDQGLGREVDFDRIKRRGRGQPRVM